MLPVGSPPSLSFSTDTRSLLLSPLSLEWVCFQCKSFARGLFHGPISSNIHYMGSSITHQKSDFPRKLEEPLLASNFSPTLISWACPAAPNAQPDLFTWYWIDGRADATLQSHPEWKPVSLLTVPSCNLFSRSPLLYIVVTNMRNMLNVYEYTLLFLFFENVRSIFSFSFLLNLKKKA